jgi:hypothetical protein
MNETALTSLVATAEEALMPYELLFEKLELLVIYLTVEKNKK